MRIAAAAIEWHGLTVSIAPPARHHTILNLMHESLAPRQERFLIGPEQQGFITSDGRFIGREEALRIAQDAKQIIAKHGSPRELYSEDVW